MIGTTQKNTFCVLLWRCEDVLNRTGGTRPVEFCPREVSDIDGCERVDWEALRAEYIAGGIGQRALAEKRGVKYGELKRRAAAEGWVALRREALAGEARGDGPSASDGQAAAPAQELPEDAAAEGEIALRVRRKLLKRLERMTDEFPEGAVTEYKTQDDKAVSLFKLRDFTAAYKELTGDLALEDGGKDGVKVLLDV